MSRVELSPRQAALDAFLIMILAACSMDGVVPPTGEGSGTETATATEIFTPLVTAQPLIIETMMSTEVATEVVKQEVTVQGLTEGSFLYGYDEGNGVQRLELGIDRTRQIPDEGERHNFWLSGILLETPRVNDEGFAEFKLGIPDYATNTFRVVYFLTDVTTYPIGSVSEYKEDTVFLPIQYVDKNPLGQFKLQPVGTSAGVLPLDQAFDSYQRAVGLQIAFSLTVGDSATDDLKYYGEMLNGCGSEQCLHKVQRVLDRVEESFQTINSLINGDGEYDGGRIIGGARASLLPRVPEN